MDEMFRAPFFVLALASTALAATDAAKLPPAADHAVDFVKDIQPIFEAKCLKCHGPEKQKAEYRLDVKSIALTGGENHAPNLLPGKSAASPLVQFVSGLDEDMKMPPKGEPLRAAQIGMLRRWIDDGAQWPEEASAKLTGAKDWWSLKPLAKPIPPTRDGNPIDAFIRAKLTEKGLAPSPEADRRTLCRRLYFDLTGLPPSPEELDAFVSDKSPTAYAPLVEKLLASPQYGERWARHWLDVAHYGDTHGYDKDQPRPNAWPYRDYVIRAFNEDKPYARFVQEQLAGDALFPGTRDGIEALGFIAAGPWDLIGHAEVPETKIDGQIARNLDRDDMVSNTMNAFCSLTAQCARCHNHKFDPVSQEDYYSLQAVFAALDRADKSYDTDPVVGAKRAALLGERARQIETRDRLRKAAISKAGEPLAEMERKIAAIEKPQPGQASKADAYGYHSQIEPKQDVAKWVQVDLGQSVALSRIVLHPCSDSFNNIGEGFGFPVRFKVELSNDANFGNAVTVIGDQTAADFANPKLGALPFPANGQAARFVRVTATKLAPRQNDFIFALAELDAFDVTEKNLASGAKVTALDSIEAPPRWRTTNLTDGYFPGANRAGDPDELTKWKEERERLIAAAMSPDERHESAEAVQNLATVEKDLAALPPQRQIYAGTVHSGSGAFLGTGGNGGKPRVIRVLNRGDVISPKQVVGPGTAPISDELPARFAVAEDAPESARRAALAQWITDPRNPLTWRSIVNRVWQYHFGRGLVDSPNDFGRMGQLPTHPELLDFLAADFRDSGGSLKKLHRLIVTSATYRQSSAGNPAAEKSDADNQFLWRMNRRKLEAEAVRDSMLMVAGQLDLTVGGPGFQDFVIEKPEHSPHYEYALHDPDNPRSHRRSIYRFIVRSQPQPFLTVLDCADPSMSVEKRNQTITPLQALAQMNNQLAVAMAKVFAKRIDQPGADLRAKIITAFRLAVQRDPAADELASLSAYAAQHGLANTCRVIFNLNEFVFID